MDFAGAEMNFLTGCAALGLEASLIGEFGRDSLGTALQDRLEKAGVCLDGVTRTERPTPVMMKEYDARRNPRSHYYRIGTAGSALGREALKPRLFAGIDYFHHTGIFPALSPQNRRTLKEAIRMAKKQGAIIGFDPNIRPKLFRDRDDIRRSLYPYLKECDIFFGGMDEATLLLTEKAKSIPPRKLAAELHGLGIKTVILKAGEKGAYASAGQDPRDHAKRKGSRAPAEPIINHRKQKEAEKSGKSENRHAPQFLYQKPFPAKRLVDPTGAGDAFAAAYIFALLNDWSAPDCLSFAAWMGARIVASPSDNLDFPKRATAIAAWKRACK